MNFKFLMKLPLEEDWGEINRINWLIISGLDII